MLRTALASALVLAASSLALAGDNPWGKDINPGDGPKLIASVQPELLAIVKAPEAARGALVDGFVAEHAVRTIEAVKRFRNPELIPLFRKLLEHEDWRVQHRALLALEYLGDAASLPRARALLAAEEPRLRERAALACIALGSGKDGADAVEERLERESDAHVRACLDALSKRIKGKLRQDLAYAEHVVTLPNGLMLTPFISGMHEARTKAPDYKAKGVSNAGGKSAAKIDASRPWTTPLLRMGEEEVSGTSLQPFANLRQGGKVYHTGLDVGACLDGAGYYAAADGIVRFVNSGSDMGTLLVVQHHLGDKRTVNAVYMHGGPTVFVKAGDTVTSGQLLGTMGLSYSIENGGHYAHLHYGLYPGPFSVTHNYGYRGVAAGLIDWYDPAHYLPVWRELTRPLVTLTAAPSTVPKPARSALDKGRLSVAVAALRKQGADAAAAEIEAAVADASSRSTRIRDLGHPTRALAFLQDAAKQAKGVEGGDALAALAKEWAKDAGLKAAMKAEAEVVKAEAGALSDNPGKVAATAAKAAYEKLLEQYGDTCLRPRLEALILGTGLR